MTISYATAESPVGHLLVATDDASLHLISFLDAYKARDPHPDWRKQDTPMLGKVFQQLRAYWAGELREFDLKLSLAGSAFQVAVWNALCEIPYGDTISYGELARRVGNPKGSRAVGLANGSNPIPIVVPCHRVIGSNGKLTGYGGGLPIKQKLLALEQRQLKLL